MKKNKLLLASAIFSVCIVGLAIAGGIRNYTSIPYWDMWDGTLLFYSKIDNGNHLEWLSQHNEHRIILSRILFWIDYKFFLGLSGFLIVINYVLVGLSAYVFCLIIDEATGSKKLTSREMIFSLLITSWMFLWVQENNFTVGFQSQFILAQLLPLCALFWLAKSTIRENGGDFIVACIFGLLSAGAMANGTLALPLMFIYALLLKQSIQIRCVLFILAIGVNLLYFFSYNAPKNHGHLLSALIENPLDFIRFVLLYLGSPFYYLFGQGSLGKTVAAIMGGFLIMTSAVLALKQLSKQNRSPVVLALLFFILYIGGTAFGTAGGRLVFGLDMALASRYTTAAIMAFSALFVAMYLCFSNSFNHLKKLTLLAIITPACILILIYQIKALNPTNIILSDKGVGALALGMGIKDEQAIGNLYPVVGSEHVLNIARIAVQGHYSIFGVYPYLDLKRQIGAPSGLALPNECIGNIDSVDTIQGVKDYVRVNGWIYSPVNQKIPTLVRIVSNNGHVAGFALTGTTRPDVAEAISSRARLSGFRGYLRSEATGKYVNLEGDATSCNLYVKAPPKIFDISKPALPNLVSNLATVRSASIVRNDGWTGTDFQHTSIAEMTILGSLIDSDANIGSLIIKMNRGDKILYRSGPTGGRQMVEVLHAPQLKAKLPVALDWVQLDFSSDLLPDVFDLKFSDNGNGWGEWSAIAVKSNGVKK